MMKLSIRTKLLGTFFILTLFFIVASASGYLNAGALQRAAKRNTAVFAEFRTVAELERRVREQVPILMRYVESRDNREQKRFDYSWRRFQGKLKNLSSSDLLVPRKKELIKELTLHQNEIDRASTKLFNLPTGSSQALTIEKNIEAHIKKIIDHLDSYRHVNKREILSGIGQVNDAYKTERNLALGVLGMVIISLSLAVVFTRYVTAPISKFHQEVKYISHGHLDRRLSIKTGDEIEELAEAFNQMVASLFEEEQTAARLQKRLLPPKKIRVKGIRLHAQQVQAKVVGGDWYDYYHTNNSIAFLIADASGKGMAGALLATLAMSSIRSEVKTPETIEGVLRKTNKTIENRLGAGNFITLFYGNLSLDNHELSYINCGHELPLLYRAETGTWSMLDCRSSLPVGISTEHFHPRKEKIFLQKGDKILLYTDGLHDARDASRHFFDMETILGWLNENRHFTVDLTIDGLLENALSFCQNQIPDDITLLGLEIVANPDQIKTIKAGDDQSSSALKS